jgi:hypothetical protein
VVDCGSGKVAVSRFDWNGSPNQVSSDKVPIKLADLIGTFNDGDSGALQPIWDLIDKAMVVADNSEASPALFFGATGGVRSALEEGVLTPADVDALSKAVSARYSHDGERRQVHFEVLSETREASLELRAARFVFSDTHAVFGTTTTTTEAAAPLNILSGGGKSCQLTWGSDDAAASLDTDLFGAQRVAQAVGENAALQWWQEHLREALWSLDDGNMPKKKKLPGPTLGITMMASAAEHLGLADRVVTAAEVSEACAALQAHAEAQDAWWASFYFDRDAAGGNPYHLDEATYKLVARLSVMRLAVILDHAFLSESLFFFTRHRELPFDAESGADAAPNVVNIEWPLGAFLSYPWGPE